MKKIFEWISLLAVLLFALVVFMLVTGCASGPMSALERQVQYEKLMRNCSNVGGIWYEYGRQNGRCDYDPFN